MLNDSQKQELQYKHMLFNKFQQGGLVDQLKLKLRASLLQKLKHKEKKKVAETDDVFLARVIASLLKDYFILKSMHYSLSVFLPEAQFTNSCFERDELMTLFGIKPQKVNQPIIQALVNRKIPGRNYEKGQCSTSSQTIDSDKILLLQQKLHQIDLNYAQELKNQRPTYENMQQRYVNYQIEMQKRYKKELQIQTKRIRDIEISAMRIQEADKHRIKMIDYRDQLERCYFDKQNKLRQRQKEAIDLVTHKMKQLEQANYQQRQKLLTQLQSFNLKEKEVQKKRIQNERFLQTQHQRIRRLEAQLKNKLQKI